MSKRLLAIALCAGVSCASVLALQESQQPPKRTDDVAGRPSARQQEASTDETRSPPAAGAQSQNASADGAQIKADDRREPEEQLVSLRRLPPVDVTRDFIDYAQIVMSVVLLLVAAYQIKLLRDTVTATKEAADAAKANAAAAELNAAAASTAAEISRAAIVFTHRPRVIVRNLDIRNLVDPRLGEPIKGYLWITNVGFTRATVLRIHTEWFVGRALPMKNPVITAEPLHINLKLMPGRSRDLAVAELDTSNNPALHEAAFGHPDSPKKTLYLLGIIKYWDEMKNIRRTVFCRRWNRATRRFEAVDDPDFEYAD